MEKNIGVESNIAILLFLIQHKVGKSCQFILKIDELLFRITFMNLAVVEPIQKIDNG